MVKTWAVLAPGESMSAEVAESARRFNCVAVNDCYKLAPWALALVANDAAWWKVRGPIEFDGSRYSCNKIDGVRQIHSAVVASGHSSGALGVYVAWMLGAKRILLLGFDNKGSHFFGPHDAPLKNTTVARFGVFEQQFLALRDFLESRGTKVVNCTPDSALKCFQRGKIEDYA